MNPALAFSGICAGRRINYLISFYFILKIQSLIKVSAG